MLSRYENKLKTKENLKNLCDIGTPGKKTKLIRLNSKGDVWI